MNIDTFIIGTGFLSNNLKKKINNSKIYSANDFIKEINVISKKKKKINLIINSFFATKKISYLKSYEAFAKKSIFEISKILDLIDPTIINKIIYTSSSSVYGSINDNINIIDDNNRNIYAGFKIASEVLLKNFCNKKSISLNICRIFNLYGKKNEFSIIEKLKYAKKNNQKVTIYNRGLSYRDYIHVDDVVKIYSNILKKVSGSNLYDIGTGKGISVIEIINKLKFSQKDILYKKKDVNEITNSIADNRQLLKKIKNMKFKQIEKYLNINEKLKFQKISKKNYIENNLIGSVIYGAGYSGKRIVKQMSALDKNNISYFVDDDPNKIGKSINNIKIISFKDLQNISRTSNVRNVIIAIPSLGSIKRLKLVRKIAPYCETVSTLPERSFFKNNSIDVSDIKDLSLDELFGKKNLKIEYPIVKKFKNSKILITGGAGSIGTEIAKQLAKSNAKKIIILDQSELNIYRISKLLKNPKIELVLGDIKDENFISNLIKEHKIDYIFHAAAYKHVIFLENNIRSAIKNNILGTYNLLKAVEGKKVKFIFISTDKAVNPKNILGETKRVGEILTQIFFTKNNYKNAKFFILRFGNVIGSDGSALPFFLSQIRNNQTILLTHKNMCRYFMSISEACNLVIRSSVSQYSNKTLFLDMGKPIKIINIIKQMFKIYSKENQKLKIKIIGNRFNEKLSEQLLYKNYAHRTSIKKIFYTNDNIVNTKKFILNLDKIISQIDLLNEDKLKNLLKKLLKIK